MGLTISRLVRSNSLSGREAAGLDELQHLTLSELEECAASAEQTAAALPSLSIWERRHRVGEIFTRAPHQPGSTAAERAVKARLWNLIGVLCLVGLIIVLSGNRTRRSGTIDSSKADLRAAVQAYDANPTAAIATYGPIAGWNVSAITDMSELFYGLQNFNADISSWDTSRVTDMRYMFGEASAFNQPLSLDTSRVTSMAYMFRSASAFNQPLSLDTSRVTYMNDMFMYASAFNQPLSLDTASVTSMFSMFYSASAFNQPLSLDTSRVTDLGAMFCQASAFNQPLDFDTSRVTEMGYMFDSASAFNQPVSFDTSNVTNMDHMFYRASAFNQPLSFDTSRVWRMDSMFESASAFNQPLSLDTSSVMVTMTKHLAGGPPAKLSRMSSIGKRATSRFMDEMFLNASSLSDANKLLIRCAWAGTAAFASAGYGSEWGPGSCAPG